jgi:hypothetical protein
MLPIRPDQTRSNLIGPDREPDFGDAPNFGDDLPLEIRESTFPKKMLKMPDSDSLQSVPVWKNIIGARMWVLSQFSGDDQRAVEFCVAAQFIRA